MPSFDITSEVDMVALRNAVEGANRKITGRYDFKGTDARVEQADKLLGFQRTVQQAREAGKQEGRGLWRRYFLVRDAFASLGPAAVLTVHRSQGSTFTWTFHFTGLDEEMRQFRIKRQSSHLKTKGS